MIERKTVFNTFFFSLSRFFFFYKSNEGSLMVFWDWTRVRRTVLKLFFFTFSFGSFFHVIFKLVVRILDSVCCSYFSSFWNGPMAGYSIQFRYTFEIFCFGHLMSFFPDLVGVSFVWIVCVLFCSCFFFLVKNVVTIEHLPLTER